MNMPLISVIIGVYNKEKYIRGCIESVLAQTISDIEVLIADDCSTDTSLMEIHKFSDTRINVVQLPTNSGLPAIPRNLMMRKARGDYIAFLDADDRWLPSKLERQLAFMRENPEFPLSHTGCFVIDAHNRRQGIRHEGSVPPSGAYLPGLLEHCWICLSSVMLRRELLDEIGLYNESPDYLTGEDWEFFFRVAARHPIGFIDQALAEYRKHDANICKVDWNWRGTPRDYLTLRRIFKNRPLWQNRVSHLDFKKALVAAANENAFYCRGRDQWGRAAWFAIQSIRVNPMDLRGWRHLAAAALHRK